MPGYRLTAWLRPLLTLAALAGVLSLAACGGGSGSPSSMSGSVAVPLAITPATATVYSGNPFTFLVTGGTQPYAVLSSDQAALPVVGTLTGNTLVVVPGSVGADTAVTLSIRDAAGQTASAAVTVRPALLLPASITITGNPNCGASGATLCSGQDGTASVHDDGSGGRAACRTRGAFRRRAGRFLDFQHGAGSTARAVADASRPIRTATPPCDSSCRRRRQRRSRRFARPTSRAAAASSASSRLRSS